MLKKIIFFLVTLLASLYAAADQGVAELWSDRYKGNANQSDGAASLVADSAGGVYITGSSSESTGWLHATTIRYLNTGVREWVDNYHITPNSNNEAHKIVLDDQNHAYVTLTTQEPPHQPNIMTLKYDPTGQLLWATPFDGPFKSTDYVHSLAVDTNANAYITGSTLGPNSDNLFTIKYLPDGTQDWVNIYDGSDHTNENGWDIAVNQLGEAYVAGTIGTATWSSLHGTYKYESDGKNISWIRDFPGGAAGGMAKSIDLDHHGNIYVTGYIVNSSGNNDFASVMYNPDGTLAWSHLYDGPVNGRDEAVAIVYNEATGNVYVTGQSDGGTSDSDIVTILYDPTGKPIWINRYPGNAEKNDVPTALVIDNDGNAYVAGYITNANDFTDYVVLKYNVSGKLIWTKIYDGPVHLNDFAEDIGLDQDRNVYITGGSAGGGVPAKPDYDYFTIKYAQYICGDANGDGKVGAADFFYLISHVIFSGSAPKPVKEAGDADGNGVVDGGDIWYLLFYFFGGSSPVCPP